MLVVVAVEKGNCLTLDLSIITIVFLLANHYHYWLTGFSQ